MKDHEGENDDVYEPFVPNEANKEDNYPSNLKKDWLGQRALTTVREDRADSVISGDNSDDEGTKIVRVAAATEVAHHMAETFGAVGPQERQG